MQRPIKHLVAAAAIIFGGMAYSSQASAAGLDPWEEEWLIMMGFDTPAASAVQRKSLGSIGKQVSAPSAKSAWSGTKSSKSSKNRTGRRQKKQRKKRGSRR